MKNGKLDNNNLKKKNFKTPDGYFQSVEDTVFSKIVEEKLPEKEGFNTPKAYFDSIEDVILSKLHTEKLNKTTGFKTPKDYFDTVEVTIINKLPAKEVKVIDFRQFIIKRLLPVASAAAIALFLFLNYNGNKNSINNVATSDIEQWIENDQITIDPYQIAEVYSDVELSDNYGYYNDEEMIEYLNGTDIESLLIENK